MYKVVWAVTLSNGLVESSLCSSSDSLLFVIGVQLSDVLSVEGIGRSISLYSAFLVSISI